MCIPNPSLTPRTVAGLPVRLTDSDQGIPFTTAVAEFIANLQRDHEAIAKKIEKALSRGPIERKDLALGAAFDPLTINIVLSLMQRSGRVALIGPRIYSSHHATGVIHSRDGYLVNEFENTADHFKSVFRDLSIANKGTVLRTDLVARTPEGSVDKWIRALIADGRIEKLNLPNSRVGYRYKR